MDEEQREQLFEYINSDPHLLIFHTLLQGYYTGQGVFTLDQFIKSNYDSVEEIIAEMRDKRVSFGTSNEDREPHQR